MSASTKLERRYSPTPNALKLKAPGRAEYGASYRARNRAVTSLGYGTRCCPPIGGLVEFRAVPRVQNAIAVLAVAAAIAMLGLTLAVPRMSLLVTEPPFAYADAS
jgi:hypothetical protein